MLCRQPLVRPRQSSAAISRGDHSLAPHVGRAQPKLGNRILCRREVGLKRAFQGGGAPPRPIFHGQTLSSEQPKKVVEPVPDLSKGVFIYGVEQLSVG